jgi:hypothetical protein
MACGLALLLALLPLAPASRHSSAAPVSPPDTTDPDYRNRSFIKRGEATVNAQALAAIGAAANQQRPTIADTLLSDQSLLQRDAQGWHIDKPETPGQQKVHPDRDNLLLPTLPSSITSPVRVLQGP